MQASFASILRCLNEVHSFRGFSGRRNRLGKTCPRRERRIVLETSLLGLFGGTNSGIGGARSESSSLIAAFGCISGRRTVCRPPDPQLKAGIATGGTSEAVLSD